VVLAAAVALYGWRVWVFEQTLFRGTLIDDAYISLRHAWNFSLGSGLNYNAGEVIEGYSNFLYTLLMSVPFFLGEVISPEAWIKGVGCASGVALLWATAALARRTIGPGSGGVLALGLAATPGMSTLALSGMEALLFSALVTGAFVAVIDRRFALASCVFAAAALTRTEGVLPFAVACGFALWTARGSLVRLIAPFGLVFGTYFAARWAYYGQLFPNTYYAKVGSAADSWERGVDFLGLAIHHLGLAAVLAALAVAAGAGLLRTGLRLWSAGWRSAPASSAARPHAAANAATAMLVFASAVQFAYIVRVGGDHHVTFGDRFVYHGIGVLLVACVAGFSRLVAMQVRMSPENRARFRVGSGIAFAGFVALSLATSTCPALERPRYGVTAWSSLGLYLRDIAAPTDVVAVDAAGAIPYFSRLPAIDMHGLADPVIAHTPTPGLGSGVAAHEKRNLAYVLGRAPRFITSWIAPAGDGPEFAGYRLAALVDVSGDRVDANRVLPLAREPDRATLRALQRGRGPVAGIYAYGLWERIAPAESAPGDF